MKQRRFIFSVLIFFILFPGCATVATLMWPATEKGVIDKNKIVEEKVGYTYNLHIKDKNFIVSGTPFCREKVAKYRETKKQHHGIIFIIIETPIWGLGLADWAVSYMISKSSEKKEFVEYIPVGIKKDCGGEKIPVTGKVMIQNARTGSVKWVYTDDKGNFSLLKALGSYQGNRPWNLFFNVNGENKYLSTVWW